MAAALDALASGARAILGGPLSDSQLDLFTKYLKLLQKWQRVQRLVGSDDPAWIVENLFLDSLLFLRVLPEHLTSLADVGSGAGFPGIPIKIVRPALRVVLIESRGKRASFLSAAVRELGLQDVEVVTARVERYAEEHPRAVDAVVMRCTGGFSELARIAGRLVVTGGAVIASGPPTPEPLAGVEWIEVPGPRGSRRWFLRHRP
jgi:16S rRNA (guanine527-N7)-methyltransferase